MKSPAILVAGILLDDPDGPVAQARRDALAIARAIEAPRTVLETGATQQDLIDACKRQIQAEEAALMAEAIVKRIALRSKR